MIACWASLFVRDRWAIRFTCRPVDARGRRRFSISRSFACDRAGKPLIFVVNAATPKAKITYEAAVALSQHGTVAPVTLHHRTDFAASMIDGRTVMEIDPQGRSAKEVTELWEYISDRLEKNFRRTVFAAPGASPGTAAASPRPVGGFGRRVVGQ